jgi:hypothetical protein
MKLFDVLLFIVYGIAFSVIVIFIISLFNKPSQSTIIVYSDETPVQQESVIWPWYSPYNWYNTWSPWSYTGGGYYGGGYGGGRRHWGSGGRPYGRGGRGANRGGFGGGGRGGGMGGRGGFGGMGRGGRGGGRR